MRTRRHVVEYDDIEPTHEFDARLIVNGRLSPLCGVKLWLPIDCHEDAHIEVTASDSKPPRSPLCLEDKSSQPRLISEIDPAYGFEIEADNLHIRSVRTKRDLKVLGTKITIDHIGRLRFKRQMDKDATKDGEPNESFCSILFRLSDLDFGSPHAITTIDYLGNRKVRVLNVQTLTMKFMDKVVKLKLHRHWNWRQGKMGRFDAGSFPVLELKNCRSLKWEQLENIHKLGQDACLLLTLAARHLTVTHVMIAATRKRLLEEWIYPLSRQRSTTEENAAGPLIDKSELEDYFSATSVRWSGFTEQQQDAVRLAIFSIHPFVRSSSEGNFLRMFNALEGLAKTWFPNLRKIHKKIEALVTAFPPRVSRLWPIVAPSEDGLDAIRNRLAHGGSMRGQRQEALLVGTDHLQVWIEQILLAILGFAHRTSPDDWLSGHVYSQWDDLPMLRAAVKD